MVNKLAKYKSRLKLRLDKKYDIDAELLDDLDKCTSKKVEAEYLRRLLSSGYCLYKMTEFDDRFGVLTKSADDCCKISIIVNESDQAVNEALSELLMLPKNIKRAEKLRFIILLGYSLNTCFKNVKNKAYVSLIQDSSDYANNVNLPNELEVRLEDDQQNEELVLVNNRNSGYMDF